MVRCLAFARISDAGIPELAALLLALASSTGCESSINRSLDGLRCDAARACVAGYECRAGECVRAGSQQANRGEYDAASSLAVPDAAIMLAMPDAAVTRPLASLAEATAPSETAPSASLALPVDAAQGTTSEQPSDVETGTASASAASFPPVSFDPDTASSVCEGACATTAACDSGACVASCPVGERQCDGRCVDVAADADHCGRCGQVCIPPQNATTRCVESRCEILCYLGLELCSGECVDTQTDSLNCGECGLTCKGNRLCVEGECTK
jgi:hypothetical protein